MARTTSSKNGNGSAPAASGALSATAIRRLREQKDSLENVVAGFGGEKDKRSYSRYTFTELDRMQLEAAFRQDWIARKVILCPAQDETREWRGWQASNAQIEKLEETERRLGVQRTTKQARTLARLFGGSVMFVGTGDKLESEELKLEAIKRDGIKFLHVVSRYRVTAGRVITDVTSPWFGSHEYYQVNSTQGVQVQVHPSRVIRFLGAETPDIVESQGWGDSALQAVDDAVKDAGVCAGGIAQLIWEAKIDVVKIPGLMDGVSRAEYREALIARMQLANVAKSTVNALLMDKEEEWERIQQNFGTLPDILKMYLLIVSGAADIPATRMLGQSPAGMSATGESDIRNYYDRISSDQKNELQPTIAPLDEMLIRCALGSRPKDIYYEWNPLWQQTEMEKATTAKSKADTFSIDVSSAIIPESALLEMRVNQLVEDGTYPGIEDAMAKAELEETNVDETDPEVQTAEQKRAANENEDPEKKSAPPFGKKKVAVGDEFGDVGAPPEDRRDRSPFEDEFDPDQDRDKEGKWSRGGGGGGKTEKEGDEGGSPTEKQIASLPSGKIGELERHTAMRDYAPKELDWEYDREYGVYMKGRFPDAFTSRDDFQAKYDAAPLEHLSIGELRGLGNSMAASGLNKGEKWVHQTFGHRRDATRILKDLKTGKTAPPIVLKANGKLTLMAGQTRLAAGLALGRSVPVKIISVQRKTKDELDYDPDQDRDKEGQWTKGGGGGGGSKEDQKSMVSLAKITGPKKAKSHAEHAQKAIDKVGLGGKMSVAQGAHVVAYTTDSYRMINESLRSGSMSKDQSAFASQLNAALSKLPSYKGTVTRGAPIESGRYYSPGMIVKERAFTSTSKKSTSRFNSNDTKFVITSKTGKDISSFSKHPGEKEVLFRSGTRFRVTKLERNSIHMTEV